MGGTIGAKSEPDKGSIFWFTVVFNHQPEKIKFLFKPSPALRNMKVLVVDDSEYSRDILAEMLRLLSFNPILASSGEEALSILTGHDCCKLVIMDWKMPGMNGIEAAIKIIQNHPSDKQLPKIIMLTAFSHDDIQQKSMQASIDAFLLKPVTQSILYDTIVNIFEKKTQQPIYHKKIKPSSYNKIPEIQGARILLVEDNPINQELATEILVQAGLKIIVANNGKEALKKLETEAAFDAVLMDIQMPEMDGYKATYLIRKNPKYKELPVIAMTANTLKGDEIKCLNSGMNAYVSKPIDVNQLFSTLIQFIKPTTYLFSAFKSKQTLINNDDDTVLPDTLLGIDIDSGLARANNNSKLFKKLLIDFYQKNINFIDMLNQSINENNDKLSKQLIHNIKGLSANLSMQELAENAKLLEVAIIENNNSNFELLFKNFKHSFMDVLASCHSLQQQQNLPSDIKKQSLSIEKLTLLLKELNLFLKQRNLKAQKHWLGIKAYLTETELENTIALDNFIQKLKFKDAQAALEEFTAFKGISLE